MGDLTPVLVAVGSIVAGLAALSQNLPRVRRLFRIDQSELLANLRELADTWEEKYGLVSADLLAERSAHAATRTLLVDEQRAGERCRRDLAAVQSDLRAVGRRRPGTAR